MTAALDEGLQREINPSTAAADKICRRNIRMMYAFQALNGVAISIAMGPVFDKYLYYLGVGAAEGPTFAPKNQPNSLVGMTESISGLAGLVVAIPVGWLVDKFPRNRAKLLRYSVGLAVAGSLMGVVACATDVVLILYLALVLLGVFMELSSSCSEAIFADSIPQGHRSGVFTTKSMLTTAASACGPFLCVLFLYAIGDEWKPHQMKAVIITGCLLVPLSCFFCFFFQDPPRPDDCQGEGEAVADGEASEATSNSEESTAVSLLRHKRFGPFRAHHVPIILACADFTTCIGAGMTVKFFNLFFIQDMKFSPTDICWLQTAYPLVIALFMKGSQRLAKPLGRAQASLTFFSCSVLCLILLSQVSWLPFLLVIFLIRGGFSNSTSAVDRSIMMDFTPSTRRGLWNAVESFTMITWSGSAFLGGLLSDSHDYRFTFLITALVYGIACVIYSPLLGLVPRKEAEVGASGDALSSTAHTREVPLVEHRANGHDDGIQAH
mmetsp:Transcript_15111/g.32571  ORF Transcript_15111/g.32571 Transcript_15111/m.32571 type:complete len:494 (-) Transcript_15111:330-1811(-)|eukprot:CAMPEP_0206452026 /NCGR_PEP_ID=MMETSP0324_2-20121206/19697_1 /ASSEMBLY_ACC=CAM_ASM_000836 /TAXON_ID=2866 /ORGANISM="Crypthecodinium cohnii, Strain Seligo" /LENGTH=493 /DNA_ID=CAMNT_0053922031 /DNA_START=251 /DNA_END=1732 /DNA_ORIENTATION=+